VPEGEKIRKEKERDKESEDERLEREVKIGENSRPKGQKKVLED
jgi:hypothetical protein